MKPALLSAWQTWAILSACFAALTVIFAMIGGGVVLLAVKF
ncbi:hypothetical protein [Bradyrhizobium zhanjiangense]